MQLATRNLVSLVIVAAIACRAFGFSAVDDSPPARAEPDWDAVAVELGWEPLPPVGPQQDIVSETAKRINLSETYPVSASTEWMVLCYLRQDAQYVQKLINALDEAERDPLERGKIMLALSAVGPNASSAAPRLVGIMTGEQPLPLAAGQRPLHEGGYRFAKDAVLGIGPAAVAPLREAIRDHPEMREGLQLALSEIALNHGLRTEDVLPPVQDELTPEQAVRRAMLLRGRGQQAIPEDEARKLRPLVLQAMRSDDRQLAFDASRLLKPVDVPANQAVPLLVRVIADALADEQQVGLAGIVFFEAVSAYGREATPILVEFAGDDDPVVRQAAVALLAAEGAASRHEVPLLVQALENDPDAKVRGAAANTLGTLGDDAEEATAALRAAARNDPSADVRDAAANAMNRMAER